MARSRSKRGASRCATATTPRATSTRSGTSRNATVAGRSGPGCRSRPVQSRGLWPAFWLRADDASGEIDVIEAWGTPADIVPTGPSTYAWNVHEDTNAPAGSGSGRFHGWGTTSGPDVTGGFLPRLRRRLVSRVSQVHPRRPRHRIACSRCGYLDSPLTEGKVQHPAQPAGRQQLLGRVDGTKRPESTRLPARLEVDYVRVFRQKS